MEKTIQTRHDLIETAKKIEPVEKRIEFIMGYFKDTLKYNYMELLIEFSIKGNFDINSNFCKPNSFLDKVGQLSQKHQGNHAAFITELEEISKAELATYISDKSEIERNATKFIEFYKKQISKSKDPEKVPSVLDFVLAMKSDEINPIIDKNGILREGVCRHFSGYLVEIMRDSGIQDVYTIEGNDHQWMVAKISNEYQIMDMTSAISVRDKKAKMSTEYADADWFHMSMSKLFEICPDRKIEFIDAKHLPLPITAENYRANPKLFEEQFIAATTQRPDQHQEQSSLGKISAQALNSLPNQKDSYDVGITFEEYSNAQKAIFFEKEKDTDKEI